MLFYKRIMLVFLVSLVTVSCGTFGKNQLSPKQQSVMWVALYNQEYQNAQSELMTTFFASYSQEKKDFLLKKLEILSELKKVLKEYDTIVWSGGTPDQQLLGSINYLIYKLTDMAARGVL